MSIATYDFLPTDDWFPQFMDFPDRGYLNEKFDRLDYSSFYTVLVLGTVFIALLWMLLHYPVYMILFCCKLKFHWPTNLTQWFRRTVFWRQWLVFGYALFIELCIVILLQAHIVWVDWGETEWVSLSFLVWIFLIVNFLLVFFLTFAVVWPKYLTMVKDPVIRKQYPVLLKGLNRSSTWAMLTNVSYYVKRITFSLVCVFM